MAALGVTADGGGGAGAGGGSPGFKSINYDKVLRLFTNAQTADLYDRQAAVLARICRNNAGGHPLKDLDALREVINITADHVSAGREEFLEHLCHMINLCRLPFVRTKANEDLRATGSVAPFVGTIAALLAFPNNDVQIAAAEALRVFATGMGMDADQSGLGGPAADKSTLAPDDNRPSTWELNQRCLERGGAVEYVVEALRVEVKEMFSFDADNDGKISEAEMDAFQAANTGSTGRSGDFGEGKGGEGGGGAASGGGAARAEREGDGDGEGEGGGHEPYFMLVLVRVVRELSRWQNNSAIMTRGNVPAMLTRVLMSVEDFREDLMFVLLETIWNMVEHSLAALESDNIALSLNSLLRKHRHENALYALGNHTTVQAFCAFFERMLLHGYKKRDKELRNELLIVSTLLARRPANKALFVETGYLNLMLEYATAAEMDLPVDANPRNFATSEEEDLELKQLLWTSIAELCEGPDGEAALEVVRESMLVQTLLVYVDPAQAGHPYLYTWAPAQKRTLELVALTLLHQLAPVCTEVFAAHEGVRVCVQYLRKHSDVLTLNPGGADESTVAGPESGGGPDSPDGGVPLEDEDGEPDADRQYGVLRLLQAVLPLEDCRDVFGELGGVDDVMLLISHADLEAGPGGATAYAPPGTAGATSMMGGTAMTGMPVTPASATPSEITPALVLEAVFAVLAASCAGGHEGNQTRFRKLGGVQSLVGWLRYEPEDAVNKPLLVVAVVSAVWEAVVGNRRSEARFVAEDGIDALLDLTESCPTLMRGQVVGCAADLLRNERVLPYAQAWKSDSHGGSIGQTLLGMWVDEEERLGVRHQESGAIASLDKPLHGDSGDGKDDGNRSTGSGAGSGSGAEGKGDEGSGSDADAPPPAFDRLRRALKAAKMWKQVEKTPPGEELKKSVMDADIRSKLFSALVAIGFDHVEDAVKGNFDDLTAKQQVSLVLASRYKELRHGQQWAELRRELELDDVELTPADAKHIDDRLYQSRGTAEEVLSRQKAVLGDASAADRAKEDEFLESVMNQRLAEESAAKLAAQGGGGGKLRPGGIPTKHTARMAEL